MTTQAEINRHDRLLTATAGALARVISPALTELFDRLIEQQSLSRLQIQNLFAVFRNTVNQNIRDFSKIIQSNIELNQSVLGTGIDSSVQQTVNQMAEEVRAQVNTQLDQEQAAVIAAVALAALAGSSTQSAVRELRKNTKSITKRLTRSYESALRQFDGAVTLLRARAQQREISYRYSGGVIPESRQFCRQMSGRIMTESQIRNIWSTQDWGGKRPGDPFVVRGGYNCRHQWIPVAGNDESQ